MLLRRAATSSGRRSTVQLPGAFARTEATGVQATPWLATLFRAGEVPLKLYLTLVMMTKTPPHKLYRDIAPSHFAEMLSYDELDELDPRPGSGTRRVQRAFKTLHVRKFLVLTKRPGHHPNVRVVHLGVGNPTPPYITLPLELWSNEWINAMSARALAVYVSLRLALAGKAQAQGVYLSPHERSRYHLSDDTWQRGTRDLIDLGLLEVRAGIAEDRWTWERRRHVYFLHMDWMLEHVPSDPRGGTESVG